MSYCVNCGVRLDASLKKCPLCNTPVIHPNETAVPTSPSPFPDTGCSTERPLRSINI